MAAPRPTRRLAAQPGADRVRGDVRGRRRNLARIPEPDGAVAALEQMPAATVAVVELLRIGPVESPHPDIQVRLGCLEQQMHVVVHKAVGEAEPRVPLHRDAQQPQVLAPVPVAREDPALIVAAGVHVVDAACDELSGLARHVRSRRRPTTFAPRRGQTPHFIPLHKGV